MIEAINITKKYGDKKALSDVSFSIQKGEVVGFLGPNGAGKTTTMRILTGYFPPTSGEVTIGGKDVFEESIETRSMIGYLPENNPLYLEMNVDEFLVYVAKLKNVEKDKIEAHIQDKMLITGLTDKRRERIKSLSKGYKQRVGIAGALIGDPEVLILDEPTIGLDPRQIIEIRELIRELGKEKTIIISSHILPEISATCSRVIIIADGKIVAEDTPDNLEKKFSGAATVLVTVRGESDSVVGRLRSVYGVTGVDIKQVHDDDIVDFEIKSEGDIDVRSEISKIIVNNNWDLLEMRREVVGLEEIFLKLTTKEE